MTFYYKDLDLFTQYEDRKNKTQPALVICLFRRTFTGEDMVGR